MKDRITIEQVKQLTSVQRKFLLNCWTAMNGDIVTDGEDTFTLYGKTVLPLGKGKEKEFSKENFLPLLSIGQLYAIINEELGEDALQYGTSEMGTQMESWHPYPLNDESIDHLWESFVRYSKGQIQYEYLAQKLSHMLIETFTVYCENGEEEKLEETEFIDAEMEKKYGDDYWDIVKKVNEIDIYVNPDDFWEYAWYLFNESLRD